MEGDTTQCKALRKDGQPCTVRAVLASGYCVMHDPAKATELAGIRAAGGRAKSGVVRAAKALPADHQDVAALILRSLVAVEDETMKPSQATAIAALAGAYARIHEAGVQNARLAALEAQLAALRLAR